MFFFSTGGRIKTVEGYVYQTSSVVNNYTGINIVQVLIYITLTFGMISHCLMGEAFIRNILCDILLCSYFERLWTVSHKEYLIYLWTKFSEKSNGSTSSRYLEISNSFVKWQGNKKYYANEENKDSSVKTSFR